MSFQDDITCFLTFCSSDQSLFLFKFKSFDYSSNVMTHSESLIEALIYIKLCPTILTSYPTNYLSVVTNTLSAEQSYNPLWQ